MWYYLYGEIKGWSYIMYNKILLPVNFGGTTGQQNINIFDFRQFQDQIRMFTVYCKLCFQRAKCYLLFRRRRQDKL